MKILPKAKLENIVVQNISNETLVYDLTTHKAYNLNETSSIVFNHCDGKTSFDELQRKHKFSDDLIFFALDELKANNLLEGESANHFGGLSRREVIRRVGLASMMALPVISAIVAPTAANAVSLSNVALGQTCTASAQCSSSAPNCANRFPSTGSKRCCAGSVSYYDTGAVVNSCSGGSCNSATFACQPGADQYCCSNSSTPSCVGNSCACRCD